METKHRSGSVNRDLVRFFSNCILFGNLLSGVETKLKRETALRFGRGGGLNQCLVGWFSGCG